MEFIYRWPRLLYDIELWSNFIEYIWTKFAWKRFLLLIIFDLGGFIVLNATFNYISVTSWRSVSLVEETGDKHRVVASCWQTKVLEDALNYTVKRDLPVRWSLTGISSTNWVNEGSNEMIKWSCDSYVRALMDSSFIT